MSTTQLYSGVGALLYGSNTAKYYPSLHLAPCKPSVAEQWHGESNSSRTCVLLLRCL